jgi:O-antigen/teichoic acid export membrane protein
VVDAVAGKSFHSASTPLMILLAGTAITLPTAAFGNSLVAERQEARLVRIGLMVLVVNVGLNLVLIPLFGIVGASAALVSSEALALVLTSVVFFRLHHTSIVPTRPLEIAVTGLAPVVGWALMIPTHFAGTQPIVRLAEVIPLMIFFVVAARLASSRLHSFDQTAES